MAWEIVTSRPRIGCMIAVTLRGSRVRGRVISHVGRGSIEIETKAGEVWMFCVSDFSILQLTR